MATNTVDGILIASNGAMIPLQTEVVEGTETSLTTSTDYTVTAQQVGDYGQGLNITHGLISADNGCSFAYILRQGLIQALIPISVKGVGGPTPALPKPITLRSGDLLRVLTLTAAARNASLQVLTDKGECRIFIATASGAGSNALVDLQTGNSIGSTLQNQRLVSGVFTSVDGNKIETPGAIIVSDANNVVGSSATVNPSKVQPMMTPMFGTPINLNFTATFKTNA